MDIDIPKEIATKVMGWVIVPTENDIKDMKKNMGGLPAFNSLYTDKEGDFKVECSEFRPSTNMQDAWLVVERMRELGMEPVGAPMAICHAALNAISKGD